MAVLSIRRYLNEGGTENTNPFLKPTLLLLEGIARHALAFDREEFAEFQASLKKLGADLAQSRDAEELQTIAKAGCAAMARYYRQAEQVQAAQTVELRCMIEMLSQTLMAVAQSGGQSVSTLEEIRKRMESARQLEDLRLVRLHLGETLKSLTEETRRQQERNQEMLRHAERAIALMNDNRADPDLDPISGLPSSHKAEREIGAHVGTESPYYAAAFVVERLDSVNLQYGFQIGDCLLHAFAQHLVSKLSASDLVYRWRGPAFVAVLKRTCSLEGVKDELAKFVLERQAQTLDIEGCSIRLPFACGWKVVPLARYQNASEACRQIDRFVSEHPPAAGQPTEHCPGRFGMGSAAGCVRGSGEKATR